MRPYGDFALSRRLLAEARSFWPQIATLTGLSLLATPIALLTPLPVKITLDNVLGDDPLPAPLAALLPAGAGAEAILWLSVAMILVIAMLMHSQAVATSVLEVYTGDHLVRRFRAGLFRHVQRLSLTFHDAKGVADSLYRIQYDAMAIEQLVIKGAIPLLGALVTLAAMVYVTVRIDWVLASVALGIAPVLMLVAQLYRRRLRSEWARAKEIESSVLASVEQVLSALRVVKAFGQERREEARFADRAGETIRARVRATLTQGVFGLLLGLSVAGGTAAVLYLGVRHVQAGIVTLGELVLVMFYLAMLYSPLATIGAAVGLMQSALASAERAFSILDRQPEVTERPGARSLSRCSGSVAFRDVSFHYGNGSPILEKISFEAPAGCRVGIAGETGSGKTTLVSLLPRFYDPTGGEVRLDGIDIREIKLDDLRRQFAIVLQDPVLFPVSIAENIAYGRPGAGREEIVAAGKAANAHEFIMGLPEGYETNVGGRGMRLSGGQRQLVSVARAFLKDAPILILDEPTSSVDVATERAMIDALDRLMKGRTTFLISHRPNTLDHCDRRVVLERGRLVPRA